MSLIDPKKISAFIATGADLFLTLMEEDPTIIFRMLAIKERVKACPTNTPEQKALAETWYRVIAERQVALNIKAQKESENGISAEQKHKNETSLDLN